MKKILLFTVLIIVNISFSQQKTFQVEWKGSKTMSTETSSIEVPYFNSEHFSFSYEDGLKFIAQWKSNAFISSNSIQVTNVNYATIPQSELKGLAVNKIPSSVSVEIKNTKARTVNYSYLEFSPIINDNGVYKKVLSLSVAYNTQQNSSQLNRNTRQVSNSVLNQGSWYKFHVDTTGVFKLSRSFLNSLGVNTNVDPRTVKIYGNGGRMLPLVNIENELFDPVENAVKFIGEEDGVFNSSDYILFYAEGPTGFNQESNTNNNIFTDKTYYYVNVSSGFGKRIQSYQEPISNPDVIINTFHETKFREKDEFNFAKLGRRWFGDRFDFENTKIFDFEFPKIVTTEPINLKVYAAAAGAVQTTMSVKFNSQLVANLEFDPIDGANLGGDDFFENQVTGAAQNIAIELSYNNNGNPASLGFLDFISIEAISNLTHDGNQFVFSNNDVSQQSGVGQYDLANASDVNEVWDVTDRFNITSILNANSDTVLSFKSQLGESKTFVALDPSDYYAPSRDSNTNVANQNIKGTILKDDQGQFQNLDYLIITRSDMLTQAERLAQINRDKNNLTVKVLTLQSIYNEFNNGNADVAAIRNLVKYIYDNADSDENKLKYLCLFGDGSYDYKDRISNNTNVVPSWHSVNSFSLSASFVADDFYGMMDANEGTMINSDKLDVAVGRILADTPQRAKELVDKIEGYYALESYGSWRNNFMVIADDVDESWEVILQGTSNQFGSEVATEKPFVNVIKVFSDAFQQQTTAGGERYPDVNKAIFDELEVGALVVNYFGHGGEDGLARERIWDKINAQEVSNDCKLPCFVTVTCEYTKFDDPNRLTAGEFMIWNKEGGAISLITTTRQIFVSVGVAFNVVLQEYLFAYGSNQYPSMAEALRLTKTDPNIAGIGQRRLVFFIGDPAMKLAFPEPNIVLTKINDVPVNEVTEPLEALSYAKMEGQVTDEMGNVLTNYNGTLTATIFDKEIDRSTLGNNGVTEGGELIILDYKTLGEKIFRGQATIENGNFSFDFIVPRDIGIPVGRGRVSFYAQTTTPLQDQTGANTSIQIGGINEDAPEDNNGPLVSLFMNDESFISGGITNTEPTLLAKLSDDNGINTASGIGHDIVAILDGDETNPFKLNDYYLADVDNYQKGTVTYPLRDLEPGLHTLTLKAWDVYNNSATSEIQFVVFDEKEELVVKNVLNYPNPFIDYTEFWFNHNSSNSLDVSIQIFTVSGKLVRTLNGQTSDSSKITSSLSKDIVWDGRDDFGDKIGKGVYVYKLTVHSKQLNKTVEKFQKLVIL